jgi:hypothetical protein
MLTPSSQPSQPKFNAMAARFATIDAANPDIWRLFERFAFDMIQRGFQHYSADAVMHRVRWETAVYLLDGNNEFKIANIWVAYYARKFTRVHPQYAGFFRLRPSQADL